MENYLLPMVISTGKIVERKYTPRGSKEEKTMIIEQCDMWLGGSRHPVEHDRVLNNDDKPLVAGQRYFLGGKSFEMGSGRYAGVEISRFNKEYITEDELVEWVSDLSSTTPLNSGSTYDTEYDSAAH